jgi:hypothetical protein
MSFEPTEEVRALIAQVDRFMDEHIFPYELRHWEWVDDGSNQFVYPPWFEGLKAKAKEAGIWNWFLNKEYGEFSPGLSNLEFAPIMERMARVPWAQEVFNCSAPDRGNMEVLARFGSPYQQETWLKPLLEGEIRSAFSMTEPSVASSDAANLETTIVRGRLRRQRAQVVYVQRLQSAVQSAGGHGQDQSRRAEAPAVFHDPGPQGHAGSHLGTASARIRSRALARRPCAGALR